MCGRALLTTPIQVLRAIFGLTELPDDLAPHFNIAPSQPLAVIRTPHRLELVRWGLMLPNAHAPKINLRVESVANNPATRDLARSRRCLVIVDGFYEWTKSKQPFVIRQPDATPFALAGIWTRHSTADGEVLDTCAILTRAAQFPVVEIHDRMPVVVQPASYHRWIDPATKLGDLPTLEPAALVSYAVSPYVNSPANDDAKCIEPGTAPQGNLFG